MYKWRVAAGREEQDSPLTKDSPTVCCNDASEPKSSAVATAQPSLASSSPAMEPLYRFGGFGMNGRRHATSWRMTTVYAKVVELNEYMTPLSPFKTWPPGLLSIIIGFTACDGEWERLADMPYARTHGVAVPLNSQIYVVGGASTYTFADGMDVYDCVRGTWNDRSDRPMVQRSNVSLAFQGRLYLCGGREDGVRRCDVFDPIDNKWTRAPETIKHHHRGCGVVHDNKLYVLGGMLSSDCEYYDNIRRCWNEIASLPEPRYDAVAVVLPREARLSGEDEVTTTTTGGIAVMGGWGHLGDNGVSDVLLNTIVIYHGISNTWSLASWRLPGSEGWLSFSAHVRGTRLYVAGGQTRDLRDLRDMRLWLSTFVMDFNVHPLTWVELDHPPIDAGLRHAAFV